MNSDKTSRIEYKNKLLQNVNIANFFLYEVEKLSELLDLSINSLDNQSEIDKIINEPLVYLLNANNYSYFSNSVIVIHSLLKKTGKEISIYKYLRKYFGKDKELNFTIKDVDKIYDIYESSKLGEFRDKIFAHTEQIVSNGKVVDPESRIMFRIKAHYTEVVRKIINEIKSMIEKGDECNYDMYFNSDLKEGFNELYKFYQSNLNTLISNTKNSQTNYHQDIQLSSL